MCASPASSATPSPTWSPCSTTPSAWSPRSMSPADNPVRVAGDGDARIFGPQPGGYGSGILPPDRAAELAHRRRPRRGLPQLGRLRLRPGGDGRRRRPTPMRRRFARHRGGGQEPGQPRARHLRLRRLPPVPRRHDRRRPVPDRPDAPRLFRRHRRPGQPRRCAT